MKPNKSKQIAIIGGGASGFFAAFRCAELARERGESVSISIFEMSSQFLKKLKISGGGRCNVTHHLYDSAEFCLNYPRGSRELRSVFKQFQAADTVNWFKARGVRLKYESDGRMFPTTDSSATIINCFLAEAKRHGVKLLTGKKVKSLKKLPNDRISLYLNLDESLEADSVLIATGSQPGGYRLAKNLGHTISELAPSLFSFKINDPMLAGLAGTSFANAELTLKVGGDKEFREVGALLVTHWGLSGPALLKLSAWAAREMQACKYQAKLIVNWLAFENLQATSTLLNSLQSKHRNAQISNVGPKGISKRFWLQLLTISKVESKAMWKQISQLEMNRIAKNLFCCELSVTGKNRFKDEFVECGGIPLHEIDLRKMESKICPGLFFSGEVMDVDGVTGGFNFQNAWSSGWIAGSMM